MKLIIKRILQALLGIDNYLLIFSLFKINTLQWDSIEGQFRVFMKLLPEEGSVIDVGANIGIMSTLLARKTPKRLIYAYEPAPTNFEVLRKVTSLYRLKNVVLFPWAIGSEERQVEMVMPVKNSVLLHGLSHVIEPNAQDAEGSYFEVPCKRLDDIEDFFAEGIQVSGIKIDVEGYEFFVLEGARRLLQSHHPVIVCK